MCKGSCCQAWRAELPESTELNPESSPMPCSASPPLTHKQTAKVSSGEVEDGSVHSTAGIFSTVPFDCWLTSISSSRRSAFRGHPVWIRSVVPRPDPPPALVSLACGFSYSQSENIKWKIAENEQLTSFQLSAVPSSSAFRCDSAQCIQWVA